MVTRHSRHTFGAAIRRRYGITLAGYYDSRSVTMPLDSDTGHVLSATPMRYVACYTRARWLPLINSFV